MIRSSNLSTPTDHSSVSRHQHNPMARHLLLLLLLPPPQLQHYFVEPPATVAVEETGSHSGGSVGPLFVVLGIIIVLGVLAGLLARICTGRHLAGHDVDSYNFEGWMESRCGSCIDGSVPGGGAGGGVAGRQAGEGASTAWGGGSEAPRMGKACEFVAAGMAEKKVGGGGSSNKEKKKKGGGRGQTLA